jgi:hypothetical protein
VNRNRHKAGNFLNEEYYADDELRAYSNNTVSLLIDPLRLSPEATDRTCFTYSHGYAILSTASGLSAYALYNMTFDAELTEPAIISSVAAVSQPIRSLRDACRRQDVQKPCA